MKRFRGGSVFKAHRLACHSTLGSRVIEKKKKNLFLIVVMRNIIVPQQNPSRAVTLPNIGVAHDIEVPHRVTYP